MIWNAKKAGADAVKLQTYTPDGLTLNCDWPPFQVNNRQSPWHGKSLYSLYTQGQTPRDWHKELFDYARELNIPLFSSPFSREDVDFLEELNCPIYKVASFEAVDPEFIRYIASTKKPMIISCGVASNSDIDRALEAAKLAKEVTLLHCVSKYPVPAEDTHLYRIKYLRRCYSSYTIGFSDHSTGIIAPIAAVAVGAKMIEKHITLEGETTIDGHFSMNPENFKILVDSCRKIYATVHPLDPFAFTREKDMTFARSIFIVKDIGEGEIITDEHVRIIRPGMGMPPHLLPTVIGKRIKRAVLRGTPLTKNLIF